MKPHTKLYFQGLWTLTRNELKRFYSTPLAYGLHGIFLAMSGFFFVLTLKATQDAGLMRYVFSNTGVLLLLLCPLISMGLVVEERAQHTLPLLLSSALKPSQIILAKYLAALILLGGLLGSTLYFPVFLYAYGQPDFWPLVTGYGGLFLLGSVFLGVGLWTSTWAKNSLFAASSAFGICLLWWMLGSGPQYGETQGLWTVVQYLSLGEHQESFAQGWLSLQDIWFYLSAVLGLLSLSCLSFQRQTP